MQVYTESTDGSYLDVKESALVWHYKDADPDFGRWQAKVHNTAYCSPIFPSCCFMHIGNLGSAHALLHRPKQAAEYSQAAERVE